MEGGYLFIENIKYIQESEKKAKKIIEETTHKGKELVKKSDKDVEKLEKELKINLKQYYNEKIEQASEKADKKINGLKIINDEFKGKIHHKALSLLDETAEFVYQKLFLI